MLSQANLPDKNLGPFTNMKGNWNFYKDVIETKKRIVLIPENGIMIYLQRKSFENQEDIKTVIEKIKKSDENRRRP